MKRLVSTILAAALLAGATGAAAQPYEGHRHHGDEGRYGRHEGEWRGDHGRRDHWRGDHRRHRHDEWRYRHHRGHRVCHWRHHERICYWR
ncbi:MAG: hypothetical protein JSR86_02115 [Proteobacteria bacterium]|nr:hypothetical protein [Pseudomonadota bacterium]